jgi:hypothetical protein
MTAATQPTPLTPAQDAIEQADAALNNAILPTYSELLASLQKLANGASRTIGADSCDRPLCRVLAVNVASARELLAAHERTMAGKFRGR